MIMNLGSNEFLRLTRARGTTVEVLDGRVWITEAGRAQDAFVSPGASYRVAGNGLVVIGMDAPAESGATCVAIASSGGRGARAPRAA